MRFEEKKVDNEDNASHQRQEQNEAKQNSGELNNAFTAHNIT